MDVWGTMYKAQWSGVAARHEIERDDGRIETFESASHYFEAPRSEDERDLMESLQGPVLDLAAGVGSYALYLQEKGFDVTAAEHSVGAIEVCRARGCRKVISMDLRALEIKPGAFANIIVMGNTLGAHQTPETLPAFLRLLRSAIGSGGHLLFTMIDPLDTGDEGHLAYQERNRERGLPPGLVRLRLRYERLEDDWMYLWMLTQDEMHRATHESGWTMVEERRKGPSRVRLFEAS